MTIEIQNDIAELRAHLERMKELYYEGRIDEAGNQIKNIFSKMLNALVRESGMMSNGKAVDKLRDLYQFQWLTDEENNHLHNLRKMRNLFVHDDDTTMSDNYEDQQKLAEYRNNFAMCIRFCEEDVAWFEEKILDVHNGIQVRNSWSPSNDPSFQNRRGGIKLPKDKSLVVLIPVAVSIAIAAILMKLFRTIVMPMLAEDFQIESIFEKPFLTPMLTIAGIVLVCGVFFSELMPQIMCAAGMGTLAYIATHSEACAFLMAGAIVFVMTRYTKSLRYALFWIITVGWAVVASIIARQFLSHFYLSDSPTQDDTFMKVFLPIALYHLVYLVGHFIVRKSIHPFSKTLANNRLPLHTLIAFALTCGAAVMIYQALPVMTSETADETTKTLCTLAVGCIIPYVVFMYILYLVCKITERKEA